MSAHKSSGTTGSNPNIGKTKPTDPIVEELLKGSVDLHIHSGPSLMNRKVDHIEAAREAEAAGMRAIMFKDHFYGSTPVVELMKRHEFKDTNLEVLSGIVLNNANGGLNPYAVEHALMLGAKMVWMPTLSAGNHIRYFHRSTFVGTKKPLMKQKMLSPIDSTGEVLDDVKKILDLIAEYDAVLSAGHFHISEIWPLFEEAKKRGVKRLLVNHPNVFIEASLADITELAGMGAYLEHAACMVIDCPSNHYPPEELVACIKAGGIANSIIGSDMGQMQNPKPVEGYRTVIALLLDLGYTADEVRQMISLNACKMLGIEPVRQASKAVA